LILQGAKTDIVLNAQQGLSRLICRLFNITVVKSGDPVSNTAVYVGNHLSYIDIPVLGSVLPANFVAKGEVKNWPLLGWIAALSGTIFIRRTPGAVKDSLKIMHKRLRQGTSLIYFPEGTSTDGSSVYPFKSTAFDLFCKKDITPPLNLQPFSLIICSLDEKPVETPCLRDLYAWYGDMTLLPHLWRFAMVQETCVKIIFHPPVIQQDGESRKALAARCHALVLKGVTDNLPPRLDFSGKVPYNRAIED
jgi:1-acyl-sn-glycerol-3-phosphate acyltransferase